jgi:hypothetical protein
MKDNNKGKQLGNDKWHHMVRALHETLDMLGEPSKTALLYALEHDYGIVLSESRCPSREQIEAALTSMFGPGAQVLINEWKKRQN